MNVDRNDAEYILNRINMLLDVREGSFITIEDLEEILQDRRKDTGDDSGCVYPFQIDEY